MMTEQVRGMLRCVDMLREQHERQELVILTLARQSGATWSEMAEVLGYRSHSSIHGRYQALLERYGV